MNWAPQDMFPFMIAILFLIKLRCGAQRDVLRYIYTYIQGVTEMQVQNWTMPIKTKNKTFYKNDKKRLTD